MAKLINRADSRKPDCSFRQFLETQPIRGQNRRLAIGFVQGFHAAAPEQISAHALLRAQYASEHMERTEQSRINKGYSALVRYLEKKLRARGAILITGTEVRKVRWQRGEVELVGQQGGVAKGLVGKLR